MDTNYHALLALQIAGPAWIFAFYDSGCNIVAWRVMLLNPKARKNRPKMDCDPQI